ncbi:MAG: hypothetical protein DDT21_01845 [Syntrophomonadaceae bacterium]|nr:hypothetical protein [Bacillota bacterium]
MNERQLTAIQACEKSAAAIAKRHGWDDPHFYLPHSDSEIEFWRAAKALSIFLAKVEKAGEASARIADDDERETKANEPVTSYVSPYLTGTVVNANTPITLTNEPKVNFSDVVGIGKNNTIALQVAGYSTWEDILQAGIIKIGQDVPTIGRSRIRALFTRAQREAE